MPHAPRARQACLALLALAASGPAHAHSLKAAAVLPLGSSFVSTQGLEINETVVGDFDGDTRPDVVVLLRNEQLTEPEVATFLAGADGTFGDARLSSLSGNAANVMDAAAADFDQDGRLDLAVTTHVGGISVLRGDGAGRFTTSGPLTPGLFPFYGVAVADFNLDGRSDVATARFDAPGPAQIYLHLANASGGFLPPLITVINPVPHFPDHLATGDFNADGRPDIVVTESHALRVLFGNGTGGFPSSTAYPTAGFAPRGIAVGDLNGDGRPDLASADRGFDGMPATEGVSVLLADGSGGFAPPRGFPGPGRPVRILIADFDADGRLDVVASGAGTFVYRGDGAGNLGPPRGYAVDGDLGSGDFDLDGRRDLVAVPSILHGDGTGGFDAQRLFATGRSPLDMVTADFDGDGRADLATANHGSDDVTILPGLGDGSFGPPVSSTVPQPTALATGDVDGDGMEDVVTVSDTARRLTVMRGDGTGHLTTVASYPVALVPNDLAVADFNGDGRLDVAVTLDQAIGPVSVGVWFGTGGGALTPGPAMTLPSRPRAFAAGFVNADVRPDLVVVTDTIVVLLGDGAGGFVASEITEPAPEAMISRRVAIAPLDGDASTDLAIVGDFGPGTLGLWHGDGFGGFAHASHPALSEWPTGALGLAVADLNDDGRPDFAVAKSGLFVAETDDKGRLGHNREGIPVGGIASEVVAADFDGDGRLDVAVAVPKANGVTVLRNGTPTRARADVQVTFTGEPEVAPTGTPITYRATVTNAGPLAARNVALSVELGVGIDFVSSVPGAPDCTLVEQPNGRRFLFCTLGEVAPAGVRLVTIAATSALSYGGTYLHATVASAAPDDPVAANNVASVLTRFFSFDIAVSQTDSVDPVSPGADYDYVVTLQNRGPTSSDNFSLVDQFSEGISFVSATPPVCAACDPGNCALCSLGPLGAGQTRTITLTVHASMFTQAQSVVSVIVPGDTDPTDDVSTETTTMALGVARELAHGAVVEGDLGPSPTAGQDLFLMPQSPRASYEVIADALCGQATPLVLERLSSGLTPLQSATPVGTGAARSLRWESSNAAAAEPDAVRVRSTSCSTDCDSLDGYRLRVYETTGRIARFNNTGTQSAVLVLANPSESTVQGHAWFWSPAGALVGTRPFSLSSRQTTALNTAVFLPGFSGSVTVAHDAPYGVLGGKCVTLEPATGFSFDTPMTVRSR